MTVEQRLPISFWKNTNSSNEFHIYLADATRSQVIEAIEALATKPLGSTVTFEVAPPEPQLREAADINLSDCLVSELLTIESAEPGAWNLIDSAEEIKLSVGLPFVAVFASMLDIDGVAFGPGDKSSKIHIHA